MKNIHVIVAFNLLFPIAHSLTPLYSNIYPDLVLFAGILSHSIQSEKSVVYLSRINLDLINRKANVSFR